LTLPSPLSLAAAVGTQTLARGPHLRGVLLSLLLLPTAASAGGAATPKVEPKAEPGPVARCTIRSIIAEEKGGGIDKRLAFLRREFGKPPFSAYHTLKLLDARDLVIPQGGRQRVNLPNGKILQLTFKERLLGRKDRLRLRMHLSITPPNERRFLPGTLFTIVNKGTLLVAGDRYKDGTLAVGITCQTK
jgi:hypothetical protein